MFGIKKILRLIESLPLYAGEIRCISGFKVKHPISVIIETMLLKDSEYVAEYLVTAPDLGIVTHAELGIANAIRELKESITDSYEVLMGMKDDKLGPMMKEQKEALRYYLDKE